jgi:hypothetical protein
MTPQQILVVAVRLFAIFWFLTAIGHLVSAIRIWRQLPQESFAVLGVLIPILGLVVGAYLWTFPATLTQRLLKGGDSPNEGTAPALLEWQVMILAALGIWTLSMAIPDAVYWITYFLMYRQHRDDIGPAVTDQLANIAETLAQIAIGMWLVLGAPNLALLVNRLRIAGLRE